MRFEDAQATGSPDLPAVRQWAERNPATNARLTENVEHGGDRVILIVSISDHGEMLRAKTEIPPLAQHPELLRFRRWKPTEQETEWTLQWVLGLMRRQHDLDLPTRVTSIGPHPVSGLIMISFSRVDPAYAAELEARGNGLAYVMPEPENPVSVVAVGPFGAQDRLLSASTPTWVEVEKPQL